MLKQEVHVRVAREKDSYDHGSVLAESSRLQERFQHVFSCPNSKRTEEYLVRTVAEYAPRRDLLDFGCHNGWMVARYAAMKPASITGIDLSESGIDKAIREYGGLAKFHCGDDHASPFAAESFDMVVGRSILHHLDFAVALKEILRITRHGGHIVFMDPLYDNPAAVLLRWLTPQARTVDEKPLSQAQIRWADELFGGKSSHLFFNMVSVPLAMLTSLTPLRPDTFLLQIADAIDSQVARIWMKY
jgi:SAM-dependent methyltransferase